jgi:hypothetical protein
MSARNNSKSSNKGPKPYCKVCHDAGKPESIYTNHFVKSEPGPNGKVVCPTLLAQECRYCFQPGHTAGYCPVIAKNRAAEEKALKQATRRMREEEKSKPLPQKTTKISNSFAAAFNSESDSEEKCVISKKQAKPVANNTKTFAAKEQLKVVAKVPQVRTLDEEFPALPSSKPLSQSKAISVMTSYAAMASKTPEEFENEKYTQQLIEKSIKRQLPPMFNITKSTIDQELSAASASNEEEYDSWDEYIPPSKASVPVKRLLACEIDWTEKVSDSDSDDEDW